MVAVAELVVAAVAAVVELVVVAVVAVVVFALGKRLDRKVDKNYLKPQHYS
jgi:hypothetical protein